MKGLVVYDSVYGNTKMVADAIAEQIRAEGHEAVVQSAKDGMPKKLDADFAFVGSPTRMARMTGPAKKFVKKLSKSSWGSKPVCLFDTIMPGVLEQKGRWSGTAAEKLHELAREKGLNAHSPVLHTTVTALKGPLEKDAADKAKAYVKDFLTTLHA